MRLLFCLFKYFPYGGLQRDLKNIALEAKKRGHDIYILTTSWKGELPDGFKLDLIEVRGITNHKRTINFANKVNRYLKENKYDLIIGFNKIPHLDVYYAADPCYKAKIFEQKGYLYRLSSRYKSYVKLEEAVFSPNSKTHILLLSPKEKEKFIKYYKTPEDRFHLLPPGILRSRYVDKDREVIREEVRKELNINSDVYLLLMVGSGFKTKGVDRAIKALASLPGLLRSKTKLCIIGEGKKNSFEKLANSLKVGQNVIFLGGREDVQRFIVGADLLVHPAYSENTGTVLIEAIVNGLPVLASDVCGYAPYVFESKAGLLIPTPFKQETFNSLLEYMIKSDKNREWRENGLIYGRINDFFSMYKKAVDIIEDIYKKEK